MSFGTDANNTRTTCKPTIIVQFPRISGINCWGNIKIYETVTLPTPKSSIGLKSRTRKNINNY